MKKIILTFFLFTMNQTASADIHIHHPEKVKCSYSTFFKAISIEYEGIPVVYRDLESAEHIGGALANCKGAVEVAQQTHSCLMLQTFYHPWEFEYFKVVSTCPVE